MGKEGKLEGAAQRVSLAESEYARVIIALQALRQ